MAVTRLRLATRNLARSKTTSPALAFATRAHRCVSRLRRCVPHPSGLKTKPESSDGTMASPIPDRQRAAKSERNRRGLKAQMTLSRPQFATCPTRAVRTAEECGRSAARTLQLCAFTALPRSRCRLPRAAKIAAPHRSFCAAKPLTMPERAAYITLLGAPPRNAMTCREAPHCLHGEHPATSFGPGGCASFGGFHFLAGLGGEWRTGSFGVSGCLTSESEERETWTAESLRAAFAIGKPHRAKRPRRDFGGRRFRSTL